MSGEFPYIVDGDNSIVKSGTITALTIEYYKTFIQEVIMILYEQGTTDFSKNGLGFLNNVLNANVVEKLNGEYTLTFDYPLNETLSNELIEERIVKCKVSDGTNQCFIIKNVVKTYEKMRDVWLDVPHLLLLF